MPSLPISELGLWHILNFKFAVEFAHELREISNLPRCSFSRVEISEFGRKGVILWYGFFKVL
jgi:hypothetical protein